MYGDWFREFVCGYLGLKGYCIKNYCESVICSHLHVVLTLVLVLLKQITSFKQATPLPSPLLLFTS